MDNNLSEINEPSNEKQSYVPWIVTVGLAVLVVGTSVLLYGNFDFSLPDSLYKMPAASQSGESPQMVGPRSGPSGETHQKVGGIDVLAERLKQKLEGNPENAEGWALLARSYVELDRHYDAIPAFERAAKLIRGDAQLLVDYADALGMVNGGRLNDQAAQLIDEARNIDPANVKVKLLAATLAFDKKEYGQAVELWEAILADPSIEAKLAAELSGNVQEARSLQGSGKALLAAYSQKSSKVFDPSLKGTVILDPNIKRKLDGTDTLFIFARAVNGPSMPVAVVRTNAVEFPYSFYLDDAHSVMPGRKLSEAKEVVVVARVSKAGDAIANPGDLEGKSVRVKPGDHHVQVLIDEELP